MSAAPVPDRFATPRATLMIDRFMNWAITVGGVGVIIAVFAIFLFILSVVLPLASGASVTPGAVRQSASPQALLLGSDEWGRAPWLVRRDGSVEVLPSGAPAVVLPPAFEGGLVAAVPAFRGAGFIAVAADGRVAEVRVAVAGDGVKEPITAEMRAKPALRLPLPDGAALAQAGFGGGEEQQLLVGLFRLADGGQRLVAAVAERARVGLGASAAAAELSAPIDLTALVPGRIERLLVDERGESVVALTADQRIHHLARDGAAFTVRQAPFAPFADQADQRVASLDWLLGDVSLVATCSDGGNRILSLGIDAQTQRRVFRETKRLDHLPAPATAYAHSMRNKSYLLAAGDHLSLRHGTTQAVRWEGALAIPAQRVVVNGKYTAAFAYADDGRVQAIAIDDPHPESSWSTFFGKVWYEGGDGPVHAWQSTGGSADDFEPKLSLVPLIFGTLKGTLYAMLFAVPIALLAAVYCAEFMRPAFKVWVKPTVEIMASLPSVVLGFLAALWLAPLVEHRVPSLLACAVLIPATALGFGWAWSGLPDRMRSRIRGGWEFAAVAPLLLAAGVAGWSAGPLIEQWCFGGSFATWWPQATGASYQQRNSLVVGFVMGFAVIPIIFTIVEDALSNVPKTLRSGSLALGASRWQTAMRVVVPTASAGILSALMIGLGRAIGETMIVVMATGNTAVMDMNIFNGMRTLSANIAVELPEAPHGSTLYRTLFLGAFLLFCLTFVINTLAEVLRQHLREKYKTV